MEKNFCLINFFLFFLGCPPSKIEAEGTEDDLQVSNLSCKEFLNIKKSVEEISKL